ncbi:3-oxoacyl-ACP reductase [Streptomyces sp. DSM 44915]|uniref:3-oxoacyl-ACP reductase n=1 Tax=Streptomyces chisholmiae TaxID=3075540 RepID=A0ABU2JPJ5_9ACTN|nr:3-oxoacyl-ACP reductase [Streptomyces sp. DSM 44915]MDT0266434.1 3-oxoacyl-ACP reductase [Streptomyces sp. DSM 44915]
MADRYLSFATGRTGARVVRRLGLPRPVELPRHRPGGPVLAGPVVLGEADGARLGKPLRAVLESCGARIEERPERPAALVFDASGIETPAQLDQLHAFFAPRVRSLAVGGRVLVVGAPAADAASVAQAAARRALDGFVRSLGRELPGGATAQLLLVAPGAERPESLAATLRFLLSARSAYVSGQSLLVGPAEPGEPPADWDRPLAGRSALVTGAARGIGAAIAETLARDGARVLCLDTPAQAEPLAALADRLGGEAVPLDITAEDAGARLRERLAAPADGAGGGLDVLVHNAGITRDRTLARMDAEGWRSVLGVNLIAVERLTDALLPALAPGGRIVVTSSIGGIAGNAGQTNYAASKAGLIGLVEALAPRVADRRITANAVAPGFIETRMTAAMPALLRQVGRRGNSLGQGGRPVDVAEAVAYLAAPASGAVSGQVLRVCGQALLGA